MKIVYCYAFIILGIVVWVLLIPTKKKINHKLMEFTTTFGGAFLFATCFLQLVPHLFFPHIHEHAGVCTHEHSHGLLAMLKPGVWVLVGFVV